LEPRYRIILPFDRPVLLSEWDAMWFALESVFGKQMDTKTKNIRLRDSISSSCSWMRSLAILSKFLYLLLASRSLFICAAWAAALVVGFPPGAATAEPLLLGAASTILILDRANIVVVVKASPGEGWLALWAVGLILPFGLWILQLDYSSTILLLVIWGVVHCKSKLDGWLPDAWCNMPFSHGPNHEWYFQVPRTPRMHPDKFCY